MRTWASLLLLLIGTAITNEVFADEGHEVSGCGGIIKLSSQMKGEKTDFSNVVVKLLSPTGKEKTRTECSPTGYYFLPIDDNGDMKLVVEGPEGWSFKPNSIPIHATLNGEGVVEVPECVEDVNFVLEGFGVSGKVVPADTCSSIGVGGVTVSLQNGKKVHETTSNGDGSYTFGNVAPGTYTVTAKHPTWSIEHSKDLTIKVSNGNTETTEDIRVTGFSLSGVVQSELRSKSSSMEGVSVFLYRQGLKKGAAKALRKQLNCGPLPKKRPAHGGQAKPICAITSDKEGAFQFNKIPCGDYTLVPFFKDERTTFDVIPEALPVSIKGEGAVQISDPFKVIGFSLVGRTVDANGQPISGVTISKNGKVAATSDENGSYRLMGLTAGKYQLDASAEHYTFNSLKNVDVRPSAKMLPDLTVKLIKVCGKVSVGNKGNAARRTVKLTGTNSQSKNKVTKVTSNGQYCFDVSPKGSYTISAPVSKGESKAGFLLAPASIPVKKVTRPILDANFQPSELKVGGTITCIGDDGNGACGDTVSVSLAPVGRLSPPRATTRVDASGSFLFEGVIPGRYIVTVHRNDDTWCWSSGKEKDSDAGGSPDPKQRNIELELAFENKLSLHFTQSGYILTTIVSHDIKLKYSHQKADDGIVSLNRGTNRICLAAPGVYKLEPTSCYKFQDAPFTFSTHEPVVVNMRASHHHVKGSLTVTAEKSAQIPSEINVVVTALQSDGSAGSSSTVTASKVGKTKKKKGKKMATYAYEYWAGPGNSLEVTPQAKSEVLFYPRSRTWRVQSRGCTPDVDVFEGRPGLMLHGTVKPALSGVVVTISVNHEDAQAGSERPSEFVVETDSSGKWKKGPLYDDATYSVSAAKTGYHFQKDEGTSSTVFNFIHRKLGSVVVSVTDSVSKKGLAGVHLSVSGDNYRKNIATAEGENEEATGTITFGSLFPGNYFVRPLLKEFVFTPTSKTVVVSEGKQEQLAFVGRRISHSAFGSVRSLSGLSMSSESFGGLVVTAKGAGGEYEESVVEASSGNFRLRGLLPGVKYTVTVTGKKLERTSPAELSVNIQKASGDVKDLNFIGFVKPSRASVMGVVDVSAERIEENNVVVSLARASSPKKAIATQELISHSLFEFKRVPRGQYVIWASASLQGDDRDYDIKAPRIKVAVESGLSKVTVEGLSYSALPSERMEEVNQSSFIAMLVAMAAVYWFLYPKQAASSLNYALQVAGLQKGVERASTAAISDSFASPMPTSANARRSSGKKRKSSGRKK
jgi:hypothetical protein